jgi:NTE family protein
MPNNIIPIFAGGGTRLPAHLGVLKALSELDLKFRDLVGVSGGSIIASLYASGLSHEDIKDIALNTNYNQFREFSLFKLIRHGGLGSGDVFEQWIDKHLQGKTFNELELDLHVVAADVTIGQPVIFDRKNTPHMKVSKAVRFSMSIPLVFSFKNFGNRIMADGSILAEEALHQDWDLKGTPILCFRLRGEHEYDELSVKGFFPIINYITLLIRTFMTTISREYINEDFWHNTIIINTGNCSAVDFKMSSEKKQSLYEIGYDTAMEVIPRKMK